MKYEVIFCIFALVLTAGVVGAFAWALLGHSKGGRAEEARTADNLAGLREEYAHLVEQQAAGRLTQSAFAEREDELALRVLEETEETKDSADPSQVRKDADNARTSLITTAAVAVMIPATAVGAYLWYGDFSALDERAVEQVRLAAQAAKSERDMQGTMASLEKAVQSNKDNLEAWELLAEQYNATGNLSQAAIAFENVVRLAPKNANAWAELADLTIALNPSDLLKAGEMAEKALAVDPWHQKGLMIGAAAAFDEACATIEQNAAYLTPLRDRLIAGLTAIPHTALNGDSARRLPGNVNVCFEGIEGESLLLLLDEKGIAASSGSACTSGSLDPSHVLLALGRPHEVAHGSLRLSLSHENRPEEIDYILEVLPGIVSYLRGMSPVWDELETGLRPHLI